MAITEWQDKEEVLSNLSKFDALEIQGVRDDEWSSTCEVDNDKPDYFTVYAHFYKGGVTAIGDFRHYRPARAFADELSEATNLQIYDFTNAKIPVRSALELSQLPSDIDTPAGVTSSIVKHTYLRLAAQYGTEFTGAGGLPIRYGERDTHTLQISNAPSNPIDQDLWVDLDLRYNEDEDTYEAMVCRFRGGQTGALERRYERIPVVERDAFDALMAGEYNGDDANVVSEAVALEWRTKLAAEVKGPAMTAELGM